MSKGLSLKQKAGILGVGFGIAFGVTTFNSCSSDGHVPEPEEYVYYDNSRPYLGQIHTANEFFELSENDLITRIILLEDDKDGWVIAKTMFQRAHDMNKPLRNVLVNGAYSGVNESENQVPFRALNHSYSDEQIEHAYDMVKRLQNHNGSYNQHGGDSFFHRKIPVKKYSKEELLYNANFDESFRERYNMPKGSLERVVEVVPHSFAKGMETVLFIYDAY